MSIANTFILGSILDTIEGFVGPYVTMVLDLLQGLPVFVQALAILGLGIFAIIGLFVFFKKFVKTFIVLAILGVIGYLVWTQTTIIQDLLAGVGISLRILMPSLGVLPL